MPGQSLSDAVYLAGPIAAARFDLGFLSLTANGGLNLINSVGNGGLNLLGFVSQPFDRFAGEINTLESAFPAGRLALPITASLAGISRGIRSAAAANRIASAASSPRGISRLGGVFTSERNAVGGRVVSSVGKVSQNDVATVVNSALYQGNVNVLSGVHGTLAGSTTVDLSLFLADVERFGGIPGVAVYDFSKLTPAEIRQLLNAPGTTIGAFCDSGACLAPFK